MLSYIIKRFGSDRCINFYASIYIIFGVNALLGIFIDFLDGTTQLNLLGAFTFIGYFLLRRNEAARIWAVIVNIILLIMMAGGLILLNIAVSYFTCYFEEFAHLFHELTFVLNITLAISSVILLFGILLFLRSDIIACFIHNPNPIAVSKPPLIWGIILGILLFGYSASNRLFNQADTSSTPIALESTDSTLISTDSSQPL